MTLLPPPQPPIVIIEDKRGIIKSALFVLSGAIAILIMGAGCGAQIASNKTIAIDNTPTTTPIAPPDNIRTAGTAPTPPPTLPATCVDQIEGAPVITSLSIYSGLVGTKLEIRGCNFAGFEGDKNAWIENSRGVKGLLYGEAGSTGKLLKVTLKSPLCQKDNSYSGLPCDALLNLTPGMYKIYTTPWGKKSNEADFAIK